MTCRDGGWVSWSWSLLTLSFGQMFVVFPGRRACPAWESLNRSRTKPFSLQAGMPN